MGCTFDTSTAKSPRKRKRAAEDLEDFVDYVEEDRTDLEDDAYAPDSSTDASDVSSSDSEVHESDDDEEEEADDDDLSNTGNDSAHTSCAGASSNERNDKIRLRSRKTVEYRLDIIWETLASVEDEDYCTIKKPSNRTSQAQTAGPLNPSDSFISSAHHQFSEVEDDDEEVKVEQPIPASPAPALKPTAQQSLKSDSYTDPATELCSDVKRYATRSMQIPMPNETEQAIRTPKTRPKPSGDSSRNTTACLRTADLEMLQAIAAFSRSPQLPKKVENLISKHMAAKESLAAVGGISKCHYYPKAAVQRLYSQQTLLLAALKKQIRHEVRRKVDQRCPLLELCKDKQSVSQDIVLIKKLCFMNVTERVKWLKKA